MVARSALFLFVFSLLLGCSAPGAEVACAGLCSNRSRCGAVESERVCLWACLAGIEHRDDKGRRCGKEVRNEVACLGRTDDCEFLLEDDTYNEGDPCFRRGNDRSNRCNEDDIDSEDLVPLSRPSVLDPTYEDYSDPVSP